MRTVEIDEEYRQLKSTEERNKYLLNKLKYLAEVIQRQESKLERLEGRFNMSELLFQSSEFTALTANKLSSYQFSAKSAVGLDDNFYPREQVSENRYIRWTGPERLNTFRIPIDRNSPKVARLCILRAIKEELFDSLKIYLDGKLTEYETQFINGVYEIMIPLPESNRLQDSIISVYVPQLYKPSELIEDSTDNRLLGLAFQSLEVV